MKNFINCLVVYSYIIMIPVTYIWFPLGNLPCKTWADLIFGHIVCRGLLSIFWPVTYAFSIIDKPLPWLN